MAPTSLHRQLLYRLTLPLIVLMVVGGLISYRLALHFSQRAYDAVLYDSARSLATQVKFVAGRATLDLPRAALEIFEWDVMDRTFFAVNSERHGLILGHPDFPRSPLAPTGDLQPLFFDAEFGGEAIRAVMIRLPTQDDVILVGVAETIAKRRELTNEVLFSMLVPQLVLLIAAVLVLWMGIRGGLAPLDAVAGDIEKRDPNDLRPIADTGPIEVRPLTRALNEMLRALTAAHASQRRFISNAAHQLRSPLAALQVQAERALRESEPAVHAQALTQVVSGVGRAAHLARQLLTLARAEPDGLPSDRLEKVDLALVAREVTSDWVPKAMAQGSDLGFSGDESGAWVAGDAALFREMLTNLIDNALRYSGPGARVTVGVRATQDIVLFVEDDGPGIPMESRHAVFDRFVRLPSSHTDGCGLGLAIVREIATLCSGKATIQDSSMGKGARVEVSFPRSA
ncbi:MAG: sensor histidine kinase [Burkholderiales bacterium]